MFKMSLQNISVLGKNVYGPGVKAVFRWRELWLLLSTNSWLKTFKQTAVSPCSDLPLLILKMHFGWNHPTFISLSALKQHLVVSWASDPQHLPLHERLLCYEICMSWTAFPISLSGWVINHPQAGDGGGENANCAPDPAFPKLWDAQLQFEINGVLFF